MSPLDYLRSALAGTPRARDEHRRALAQRPTILSGLAELQRQCGAAAQSDDRPIFLLSAGWRSGSTLLQRLIMSDSRVLLWGEPYDECGIVQTLAETIRPFRPGWPPDDYFLDRSKAGRLSGEWIANLFPSLAALRSAHLAFFREAFALPAQAAGASRWGLKEVRLTAEHAHYLKWLYPGARFVLLYRNPLEAYRSYCRYGRNWYDVWPDKPVFTPLAFGRHWRELTQGFLRDAPKLDAMVVRYEELVKGSGDLLGRLESYLDITIDRNVLGSKVGSSERGGEQAWVSRLEKSILRRAVAPVAEELGYRW